MHIYVPTVDQ